MTLGAALIRAAATDHDNTVQGVDTDSGVGDSGDTAGAEGMIPAAPGRFFSRNLP
jgi:hypothetical protein